MGVLGVKTPEALLNAVFFYNGMFLILCGGEEHRKLKLSQFKFSTMSDPKHPGDTITCVIYTEHGLKNRPGGTHQLNLDNKEVVHYSCAAAGERCYVSLLQLYISKLPASAIEGIFSITSHDNPRSLSQMVRFVMRRCNLVITDCLPC